MEGARLGLCGPSSTRQAAIHREKTTGNRFHCSIKRFNPNHDDESTPRPVSTIEVKESSIDEKVEKKRTLFRNHSLSPSAYKNSKIGVRRTSAPEPTNQSIALESDGAEKPSDGEEHTLAKVERVVKPQFA